MKPEVTEEQYLEAKVRGLSRNTVNQRLGTGRYTIEQALTMPLSSRKKKSESETIFTEEQKLKARQNGISITTAVARYKRGTYTAEEAVTVPTHMRAPSKKNAADPDVFKEDKTKCPRCARPYKEEGGEMSDNEDLQHRFEEMAARNLELDAEVLRAQREIDTLKSALRFYTNKEDGAIALRVLEEVR